MTYRRFSPPGIFETDPPATVATLRQNSPFSAEVSQESQLSQVTSVAFNAAHLPTVAKSQLSQVVNPEWDELDWLVAFEERAGILEFDEGLSRSDASRLARQQIDEQRRAKWH